MSFKDEEVNGESKSCSVTTSQQVTMDTDAKYENKKMPRAMRWLLTLSVFVNSFAMVSDDIWCINVHLLLHVYTF